MLFLTVKCFTSNLLQCEDLAKPLQAPENHAEMYYKGLLEQYLNHNENSIRREYEMMVLQRAEINELLFMEVGRPFTVRSFSPSL